MVVVVIVVELREEEHSVITTRCCHYATLRYILITALTRGAGLVMEEGGESCRQPFFPSFALALARSLAHTLGTFPGGFSLLLLFRFFLTLILCLYI